MKTLSKCKEKIAQKRIIFVTDSAYAYNSIYHKTTIHQQYPEMQKQVQELVWNNKNIILTKVAAHLDIHGLEQIEVNKFADLSVL